MGRMRQDATSSDLVSTMKSNRIDSHGKVDTKIGSLWWGHASWIFIWVSGHMSCNMCEMEDERSNPEDQRRLDSTKNEYDTAQWRIYTDRAHELARQHNYQEAQVFLCKALHHAEKGFGETDPHVASAKQNLAELYRLMKQFDKAAPLYEDAIGILKKTYGTRDIRLAFALHNVAGFYMIQRQYMKAEEYYMQSLQVKLEAVGPGHTETINTMFHLSEIYWAQHKYAEAVEYATKALDVLRESSNTMNAYNRRQLRTAQMLLKVHRAKDAQSILTEMLEMLPSDDSSTRAETLESLGRVERALGNFEQARSFVKNALRIRDDKKLQYPNKYCACLRMLAGLNQDCMHLPDFTEPRRLALQKDSCVIVENARSWASASLDRALAREKSCKGIKAHQARLQAQYTALELSECMQLQCTGSLSKMCVSDNDRYQCVQDIFHNLDRPDVWPQPISDNPTEEEFFESYSQTERRRLVFIATLMKRLQMLESRKTCESTKADQRVTIPQTHKNLFSQGIPSWLPTD